MRWAEGLPPDVAARLEPVRRRIAVLERQIADPRLPAAQRAAAREHLELMLADWAREEHHHA